MSASADSGGSAAAFASQFDNPEHALERAQAAQEKEEQQEEQAKEAWGMKQRLQEARAEHTFTVEMYGVELPFTPLPEDASRVIDQKRNRMAKCLENDDFEAFVGEADAISANASEWLAEAWDGDSSMSRPEDWEETYDDDELMELLTKVDQRGEGEDVEAVIEFLRDS